MKKILIKIFMAIVTLITIFFLSGCVGQRVMIDEISRPKLEIVSPAPLELAPVDWKVLSLEGKPYFALDSKNYTNLSNNTEKIQNHIILQQGILDSYKEYYESLND